MLRQLLLFSNALLVALLAYVFSHRDAPQRPPFVQGKNRTALFLVNQEYGFSNVHVTTASALLENWPDVQVHFASFPGMGPKLQRVSRFARSQAPATRDIVFHELKGLSYMDAFQKAGKNVTDFVHAPAAAGISHFCKSFPFWASPWTVEDHLAIYKELADIIDEVDPAVVVLDTMFRPAFDATHEKNRLHAIVSPNTILDSFPRAQPYLGMVWKYPLVMSGFAYPIPLRKVPENIYLALRIMHSAFTDPTLYAKEAALKANGVLEPADFLNNHRAQVPWISVTTHGASVPVEFTPPNVTCVGPIVLSVAPAIEQDPELAEWLSKAPTVLLNLGSLFTYTEAQAAMIAQALEPVLSRMDVQILWKFTKASDYPDELLRPLQKHIDSGRLRIQEWLTVDPSALLETGHIVALIHHGGSNTFHEAIDAGVPHVILPQWSDLYMFASIAETTEIGVWGCRDTSPGWTVDCLSSAILKALDGGEASSRIKKNAKQLGQRIRDGPRGRDTAAQLIAELTYVRD